MKIIKRIIIILGVVFLAVVMLLSIMVLFIKNIKAKDLVEAEIEKELGISISIEKLEFSPLLMLIKANGVTIDNPDGFEEKELAYLKYIDIVWDPLEMIANRKPVIYVLALDLERLNIIKDRKGRVNIKELLPIKNEDVSKKDEAPFSFGLVVLSIGEVQYTDYTAGSPKVHKYTIGIKEQTFIKLDNEQELIRLVVYKAIQNTDVGKLINLTMTPIITGVTDSINSAFDTMKVGAKSVMEITALPFKLLFGK